MEAINGSAIGAALLCYVLIIMRIINVVRQKSTVMQIFADISDEDIKEMLKSISHISINDVAYDSGQFADREHCKEKNEIMEVQKEKITEQAPKQTEDVLVQMTAELKNPIDPVVSQAQTRANRKRESLKDSE